MELLMRANRILFLLILSSSIACFAQTFKLEWSESCGPCIQFVSNPAGQEVSFRKEPAYTGPSVTRGVFVQEGGASKREGATMGFAYDAYAQKIYLDLNHNWDLTDDPGSPFAAMVADDFPEGKTVKADITFKTGPEGKQRPYRVYIRFDGRWQTLQVQSGWIADGEIGGRQWHMTLVDNLDGVIDERDSFEIQAPDPEYQGFAPDMQSAAQDWVLEGHTYRFEIRETDDGSFEAVPVPQTNATAELNLPGKDIRFLRLKGPQNVALPSPKERALIPPGEYTIDDVILWNGTQSVKYAEMEPRSMRVDASAPATLLVGGPLNNSADIARLGSEVQFMYKLIGIDGEQYQFAPGQPLVAPTLKVYRGGQLLAQRDFRYG